MQLNIPTEKEIQKQKTILIEQQDQNIWALISAHVGLRLENPSNALTWEFIT